MSEPIADHTNELADRARPRHRLTVALGWLSIACCVPAIVGVLGSVIPTLVLPGSHWSLEIPWHRAVVSVFEWSVIVALVSPSATVVGSAIGVWAILRNGWAARLSKVIAATLGCAVFLTLGGAGWFYATVHRRPDPAAEQPAESLPAGIRTLHDSCLANDAAACARLGARYDSGEDVPLSGTVAARYYVKGCDLGDSNSCMNAGTLFFYGGEDPPRDPARGLTLLERSCQQRHPLGCLKIGIVYRLGHGVPADAVAAGAYFKRACELGLADGCKWSRQVEGE